MKKSISLLLIIIIFIITKFHAFSQSLKGNEILGLANLEKIGSEVALSENGDVVAIGAKNGSLVRIYNYENGTWSQLGTDINFVDLLVSSVKLDISNDGQTIICGYYDADPLLDFTQVGVVKVFRYMNGSWVQLGSDLIGETESGQHGYSVSISADGNTIAFGEYGNYLPGPNRGKVKVFTYDGTNWILKGTPLIGVTSPDLAGYGCDLNAVGDILAIGAPGHSTLGSNRGQVRIYEYVSGNWSQIGNSINGPSNFDQIGMTVKLNSAGDRVAFSLYGSDVGALNAGEVQVYSYSNGVWSQMGTGFTGVQLNENLGINISLSGDGDRLFLSSPKRTVGGVFGIAYLLYWDGSSWSSVFNLQDTVSYKLIGRCAIAPNGLSIVIGYPSYDVNLPSHSKGRVLVYENIIDTDDDGLDDLIDNCPAESNSNQLDYDNDGVGNVCDNCVNNSNTNQIDSDNDSTGDVCDECPNDPNKILPGSCGCGNLDIDIDGDTVADCIDNCPSLANSDQADADCDGVGDECDICPGGDDAVDNDNNGLPDCKYPPNSYSDVIPSWKCGTNKIYLCHNGNTKCLNYNSAQNHINHGDYLGPCGEANCGNNLRKYENEIPQSYELHQLENDLGLEIVPNPNRGEFNLEIEGAVESDLVLEIINSNSKICHLQNYKLQDHKIKIPIKKDQLSEGTYFVRVTNDRIVKIKKLIIIK